MAILISMQSVLSTIADAIAIGIIYDRLSRAEARGATILFSKHAVVRPVGGLLAFQFRVAELQTHQLSEAHVRMVVVRHDVSEAGRPVRYFETHQIRVHSPDDELGGMLFLAVPHTVTHCMLPVATDRTNPRSPLLPTRAYLEAWR